MIPISVGLWQGCLTTPYEKCKRHISHPSIVGSWVEPVRHGILICLNSECPSCDKRFGKSWTLSWLLVTVWSSQISRTCEWVQMSTNMLEGSWRHLPIPRCFLIPHLTRTQCWPISDLQFGISLKLVRSRNFRQVPDPQNPQGLSHLYWIVHA